MNDKFIKMISPRRFRESSSTKDKTDGRNPFENDLTRVTLSSHFRRLQDKAQVFPLEKSDFVRTRLTHSIEVACFARGLGLGVEQKLLRDNIIREKEIGYIPAILEVAGLVHDVGNPPFGHFGEEVIRDFFRRVEKVSKDSGYDLSVSNIHKNILEAYDHLSQQEKNDFLYFDGNPQGFRVLRRLGLPNDGYSYNLNMAVLATIIKYPYSSIGGNNKEEDCSRCKFGFFSSEEEEYEKISKTLGLVKQRHPLTYLLEAADDIAYSASDLEDGSRLGIISLDQIKSVFQKYNCYNLLPNETSLLRDDLYVQEIRINAQSKLLIEATKSFIHNFDDIVDGRFKSDIITESEACDIRKAFEELSYYNFVHKTVLKRELLGEKVVSYLLQTFCNSLFSDNLCNNDGSLNRKSKEYKILSLISDNYKDVACNKGESIAQVGAYQKFMLITDYISGMTDSYALRLYQELSGVSIS